MPQSSAPITGVNLSDQDWRDLFGDEPGIVGDLDGTAYNIILPTNSDVAQIGSTTQRSMARVAGFVHRIPAGETSPVTIPAAVGTARTDLIGLGYDPTNTGEPGPVRLGRTAGTSAAIPSYDASAPGAETLPLWAVTRQPGQALSQATVVDLRTRTGPVLSVPASGALPTSAPLGSLADWNGTLYRRVLDAALTPSWVKYGPLVTNPAALDGGSIPATARIVNVRSSYITNVTNTAGGFQVLLGFTFTKLIAVAMTPGDRVGNVGFIVPIPANHTVNSAGGVAYQPGGTPVANGSTIRVEVDAVGYVL